MLHKMVAFGDSILRGVVYDEETGRYQPLRDEGCLSLFGRKRGVEVDNHAKFGMTSEKGLCLVERALQKPLLADTVLVSFGGNDIDFDWAAISATPTEEHLPNTPPDRYEQNLRKMVEDLRAAGQKPVLMTLPPIDAKRYFAWVSRGLSPANILRWLGDVEVIARCQRDYDAILRRVAASLRCAMVDVRAALLNAGNLLDFLCIDGIHPNRAGHAVMAAALCASL